MSAAPQPIASGSQRADPKFIYVVDDEQMVGDVVQIILKMDGYKPQLFQNPELALQALAEAQPRPGLLLTDYLMSPINGMELIERCKLRCPDLRTILYSGNAGPDVLQRYSVQPDAFLSKPFLPRTLLNLVRATLAAAPAL